MLEERLYYLSLLCLEKDIAKSLSCEEELKESAAKKIVVKHTGTYTAEL